MNQDLLGLIFLIAIILSPVLFALFMMCLLPKAK
jgi:hypothetical protein